MRSAAIALLVTLVTAPLFAAKVETRTLMSRGKERTYSLFVPDGLDPARPVPLLLTLHGSGRNGASLVDKWKTQAMLSRFIVAGPDSINPAQWISPEDGPQLLYDLTEALAKQYPIDHRRVYLFGHSGGACFALQIGMLESEYFAAVAIHAGALQPAVYGLTDFATRKIPIGIWSGTRDASFPIADVRATRDALVKSGIPAELTEMPNHTHDYYGPAAAINKAAWDYLAQHALPAEPKFTKYSNT